MLNYSKNILVIFGLLAGCAGNNKIKMANTKISSSDTKYHFTDKSGNYELDRKVDVHSSREDLSKITTSVHIKDKTGRLLEKSILASHTKKTKEGLTLLMPSISQYTVWLDNKKYFSQIEYDKESNSFAQILQSPDKKWNGKKKFVIKNKKFIHCFYSQIVECVNATGFFETAIREKTGEMSLNIIWEGHPFFFEQYSNLSGNLISEAQLTFDGEVSGTYRFNLDTEGQIIFVMINKKIELEKIFWVNQSLILSKDVADTEIKDIENIE